MNNNKSIKILVLSFLSLFILSALSACTINNQRYKVGSVDKVDSESNKNALNQDRWSEDTALTNNQWKWLETTSGTEIVRPRQESAFILNFNQGQTLSGTTDCNNYFGQYKANDHELFFDKLASTLMYCDNSQEQEFIKSLSEVDSYFIDENNDLNLSLKGSGAIMRFEAVENVNSELDIE